MSRRITLALCFIMSALCVYLLSQTELRFDKYRQPEEVASLLKAWNAKHPQLTELLTIGKSTGKRDIHVIRIAAAGKNSPAPDARPAIFVSANVEGYHLVGTEAALMLIEKLLSRYGTDNKITTLLEQRTVYVAPLLNPDVASSFFAKPRYERRENFKPMDEDLDDLVDEDGPDDLNGDGLITQMRVKDPEGQMIPDPGEPRLMRKADPKKGEKGIYKVYTEGLDNDGDGEYNEDPPGGVEVNRNFPHDFEYDIKTAGLWPVSQDETIALVKFLVGHPRIAMVLNFSTENTILNLQQTGRPPAAGGKIRVPERYALFLGLDPEKDYDMKELIDAIKESGFFMGQEIDESMIAMMLGLGAAMTLDRQDLPYIEAVQKDYKTALKEAGLDYLEKRAQGVGKGSFVAYCYFQYGVQVFSADLWTVPEPKKEPGAKEKDALTVEKLKTMSPDEFLALEDEQIEAFLKEQGAPPNFKASMVKDMVKSGRITPEQMVQMMDRMPKRPAAEEGEHPDSFILHWSDTALEGKGFVDWTPYTHPTLGEVEIGGFVPYLTINPPPSEIQKTCDVHTDFYLKLMERLPVLAVRETQVESLGDGLYHLTVYFTNNGWFPTSTAQGRRAGTAWPIRVELKTAKDQALFSGRSVVNIPFIGGSGETRKVEWTIRARKGSTVTVTARTPRLNTVTATLVLQ